jgi:hypothetical protein
MQRPSSALTAIGGGDGLAFREGGQLVFEAEFPAL